MHEWRRRTQAPAEMLWTTIATTTTHRGPSTAADLALPMTGCWNMLRWTNMRRRDTLLGTIEPIYSSSMTRFLPLMESQGHLTTLCQSMDGEEYQGWSMHDRSEHPP